MITFQLHNCPGFYWLTIKVGGKSIGSIAKNLDMAIERYYYAQVTDSLGNTCFAKRFKTVEKAKSAILALPLSILPVTGTVNASGALIEGQR